MVKKEQIRKNKKGKIAKDNSVKIGDSRVEKTLVENFIALQKILTHLSSSFDSLSNRISKLLDLFEMSAKALAEKDHNMEKNNKNEREMMNKMDKILEENKILAKGVALLHEGEPKQEEILKGPQQPPQIPPEQMSQRKTEDMGGYQKSISSKPPVNKP